MAEVLKKYRVKTIDGKIQFIEAKNIHDARSKARMELGQLPNDVNLKIVVDTLAKLQNLKEQIEAVSREVKVNGKALNWDSVYKNMKIISEKLSDESTSLQQLAGSLVKVNAMEE